MLFDLGPTGLGLLAVIAVGFGLIAQFVGTAGTRWEWLISASGWFAGGFVASEVMWGTLTEAEIQPIIDGLAFDESLLGGAIAGGVTWLVTRYLTHGTPFRRSTPA